MTTDIANADAMRLIVEMQAQLASQQAEIEALRARGGDPGGDIDEAIRQFAADRVQGTTWTTSPCQQIRPDGRVCGFYADDHVAPDVGTRAKVADHPFRLNPYKANDKPKPRGFYAADVKVKPVEAPESITDTYVTVAQAAKMLGMKPNEVKALVADGQLKADKIGSTTLVRKIAVERIVAMAQTAEADAELFEEV